MSGALHPQVSAAYFHSLKIFSAKSWTFVCFHLFISEARAHPALLDLLWAILLLFCNLCLCLLFLKLRPIMEVCENGKKKKKIWKSQWAMDPEIIPVLEHHFWTWPMLNVLFLADYPICWCNMVDFHRWWKWVKERVRILPSPVITVVYHCCSKCGDLITLLSVRFDYWM